MRAARRRASVGFTLVELLVVTVILGMLAAISARVAFTVIATAKVAQITTELKLLETALKDYNNEFGSYPPMLSDREAVRRHVDRRWPESLDELPSASVKEAPAVSIAFWLGKFSDDPERPFSGDNKGGARFDFVEQQLGYEVDGEKTDEPREQTIQGGVILYWMYYPPKLFKPYVYFESRSYETARYDEALRPYRKLKRTSDDPADRFVNPGSFQIICAGSDNEYGTGGNYPEGPYDTENRGRGDDNITNFSGRKLEDAKP